MAIEAVMDHDPEARRCRRGSLKERILGIQPVGDWEDPRRRRVHLRRHLQIILWHRIPRRVRGLLASLAFNACECAFRLAGRRRPTGEVRRIVLIKLDHIGDLLLATPAIRALRLAYPESEITGVVGSWAAPVARANPHLDRVLIYDGAWHRRHRIGPAGWWRNVRTRLRLFFLRPDLAVNLRGDHGNILLAYLSGARLRAAHMDAPEVGGIVRDRRWLTHPVPFRQGAHAIERCLDVVAAVGARPDDLRLEFPVPEAAARAAEGILARLFPSSDLPVIAIHPGGGWRLNWWPAERFAALADWLAETRRGAVLFVGGREERALVEGIRARMRHAAPSICGETTLEVLAAVLRRVSLFVGNDGGVMHLAEAMGTPLVALFGCSPAAEFGLRSARARIVQGPVPDPPCPQWEWAISLTCPAQACMRGITLQAVQAAVLEMLPAAPGRAGER